MLVDTSRVIADHLLGLRLREPVNDDVQVVLLPTGREQSQGIKVPHTTRRKVPENASPVAGTFILIDLG